MDKKAFHLYIHLPFCVRRCGYCDFYSETGKLGRANGYVGALLAELEDCGEILGPLKTVYLGGGTPALIGKDLLERLLGGVPARPADGAEVTMEANPTTITGKLAVSLKDAGITRVSLGAQSFMPRLRQNLGRGGQAGAVRRAVDLLRDAGFSNVGLDMIFGIPGQEINDLRLDIEAALELRPEHISYYELSATESGQYRRRWRAELDAQKLRGRLFYETVVDSMQAAGYAWYETSSFALPGRECRHNLAYWQGADFVGLGAGAWSTVGLRRWRNLEDIEAYVAGNGQVARDNELLSHKERIRERLVLGLRRSSGVDISEVDSAIDRDELDLILGAGFLQKSGNMLRLTREGRFIGNEVCARLIRC
ncbi:MAG: radical SAM family heme chaperone HemW [Thermoleophilia bacterium]|nr:radical SAM family heme chaperone HemW [Thermoleophilia bacterium]